MPTIPEHEAKAAHNEAFLETVRANTQYRDWHVTVLYYAAVHRMQMLLHDRGCSDEDCRTHRKMQHHLAQKLPNETGLYGNYRQLEDDSLDARYSTRQFGPEDVRDLEAARYAPLRERIQQLMP